MQVSNSETEKIAPVAFTIIIFNIITEKGTL